MTSGTCTHPLRVPASPVTKVLLDRSRSLPRPTDRRTPREGEREGGHARHRPLGPRRDNAGAERVLEPIGRSDRIHLALASATHPLVRETLARVTRRRLAYMESCYLELGQPRREAQTQRALRLCRVRRAHLRLEAPDELPVPDASAA
jgi:hypothetical protein